MIPLFYDAKADIKGGKDYPSIKGVVYFKEFPNNVMVTAKIEGLPQAKDTCIGRFFGFHIHEGISCSGNVNDELANVTGDGKISLTDGINNIKITVIAENGDKKDFDIREEPAAGTLATSSR